MSDSDFLFIQNLSPFIDVPESSLRWMYEAGEVYELSKGEHLFEKDAPANYMHIIIEGTVDVFRVLERGKQFLTEMGPTTLTSQLPYSRMKVGGATGEVVSDKARFFRLHIDHFPTMIQEHYELTRALVQHMTSRVRNYTQLQTQNEKLLALGKLSAGLAHELNNPASAMTRSASELSKHLLKSPQVFKKLMRVELSDDKIDAIQDILQSKLAQPSPSLAMMQRNELEEDMADWLEAHGEENGFEYAEHLVEFGFTTSEMEELYNLTGANNIRYTLHWLNDQLQVVRMVSEIENASKRIGDLVGSIKRYSHMDRDLDRQPVDINAGIQSTLTLMAHKCRKNRVTVDAKLDENLPPIQGLPGELNQVWTNLIDNALDAMEENGGYLRIQTQQDDHLIKVSVSDTGPGIPEDVMKHIYEPFYTTKPQGKGTGLGLDITRKIIERHHAQIRVESQPGNTTFRITFTKE
ncbi:MAG: GHKL domain-containing protein [Bacteroidetes bacterium]|nr:MAG: GHKL domain-containing protein [Bacteroidota bacterium]